MNDKFEFTLHSPLTKEDWNKLSDAELENTISVTFQTPQGRKVKYIRCEVLDKLRAEIVKLDDINPGYPMDMTIHINKDEVLQIIDKCRAEMGYE